MKRSTTANGTGSRFSVLRPGALSWKAGWLQFQESSVQGDVAQLLEKANRLILSEDTKEKVLEVIETYETALKKESKNREALTGAAWYSLLIGYGYSETKEEERTYFLKTITHSEQLMYLNQEFANLVDRGEKIWEACRVLSQQELEALFCFYMAAGGLWTECLSRLEKILSLNWVARSKKALKAMMKIDPTWEGGTPYYAAANYYALAPRIIGGDLKKAEEYYKKAIELGPEMLNFRRTRALSFHTRNKDRPAFKKDLNWVISQDPSKVRHYLTYPYNIFIQRSARDALEHIDDYFS